MYISHNRSLSIFLQNMFTLFTYLIIIIHDVFVLFWVFFIGDGKGEILNENIGQEKCWPQPCPPRAKFPAPSLSRQSCRNSKIELLGSPEDVLRPVSLRRIM